MVAILAEPGYGSSVWGKNLYKSLVQQLRQKRIPFCEITDSCPADAEAVFLIGANLDWTTTAIAGLNRAGHQPILLCNQYERIPGCLYSCVCSDVNASMRAVLEELKRQNRTHVALYGMGSSSIADVSRASSLFSWLDEDFSALEVFFNGGSLERCFEEFFARRQEFDAVLCANDYAAVSLVRRMGQKDRECLASLKVISCAGTKISGCYRDAITSLRMDFAPYGKAALYIYECLQKNPYVSGITVNIRWNAEGEPEAKQAAALVLPVQEDGFYADPEIRQMLIVDRYLNINDPLDREILEGLLAGKTYQSIADRCFMTEGTVKYRVRRLVQQCGAESKGELLELLRQYLQ